MKAVADGEVFACNSALMFQIPGSNLPELVDRIWTVEYLPPIVASRVHVYTRRGRKKEIHVNKTVLAALVSAAGLATSAYAQNGTYVIEVRLVVDGSADAPTGSGIQSFLPGPQATRVGLTLQARVRQTATGSNTGSGNYGIAGVVALPGTGNAARLTHNDSTFSGGSYLALRRGQSGTVVSTADNSPIAGFFGGENNPNDLASGAARNFRGQGVADGTTPDVNSETGNAAGATGANSASANGFFNNSASGIAGLASTISAIQPANPTLYANGVDSPWYNLYRAYFDPQANTSDPVRNVTVTFSGRVLAVVRTTASPTGGRSLTTGGANGAQNDLGASATFQVPTPGAMALLGLGGLAAARRRRA